MGPDGRRVAAARAMLADCGAAGIAHPGGTLGAHLERVYALLGDWQARPALRLAGLCHALYGTDGFPVALRPLSERARVRAALGEQAEALVYRYASCDRVHSYRTLPDGPFRDRFTGNQVSLPDAARRDFAELTAANELDLARVDAGFLAAHGPGLLALFTAWRPLLSGHAQEAVRRHLG